MAEDPSRAARAGAPSQEDVDRYISDAPEGSRAILAALRKTVRSAAPGATGRTSYGMPMFFDDGMLVGFAAFKGRSSFFVMSYETLDRFKDELKPFLAAKATLRFTAEHPLPAALVRKIVKARVQENRARASERKAASA